MSLSILIACTKPSEGTVTLTLSVFDNNETSNFQFKDANLLEVLNTKYDLETTNAGFTKYVNCIKEICGNDEYSWIYYLNNEPISFGLEDYYVQDGDEILIVYENS